MTRATDESAAMVNVIVDPLSDHVGYHILHWIISQSGAWYTKVNENLQDNLRSLETGVAVIDDILTPKEEELPYENQQRIDNEESRYVNGIQNNSNDHHINILNQIINMNINYSNESTAEVRRVRGSSAAGKPCTTIIASRECFQNLQSPESHVGPFPRSFETRQTDANKLQQTLPRSDY